MQPYPQRRGYVPLRAIIACIVAAVAMALVAAVGLFGSIEITYPEDANCGTLLAPEKLAKSDGYEHSIGMMRDACAAATKEHWTMVWWSVPLLVILTALAWWLIVKRRRLRGA